MSEKSAFCFVDVDTQYDFMFPEGKLPVPGAQAIVPQLKRLTQLALEHSIPTVCSMDAHRENDLEFKIWPPHCVVGAPGQRKLPETLWPSTLMVFPYSPPKSIPEGTQLLLQKETVDLFDNADMETILNLIRPEVCVVYGVATEVCVLLAARGLRRLGYETWVVQDAIQGLEDEAARRAMEEMRASGARFVSTAEAVAAVEAKAGEAAPPSPGSQSFRKSLELSEKPS